MKNNVIIINGNCITMDKEAGRADWICMRDGQIFALGKGNEYEGLIESDTHIIDAAGRTVLPGFIDNHFHLVKGAFFSDSINVEGAESFDDIGDIIRQEIKKSPDSFSIDAPAIACGLEPGHLKEGRYPVREDLDKYVNDIPLVVYTKDYHVMMLNTCAILNFKIPYMLPGVCTDKEGLPNGIFIKQAAARLEEHIMQKYSTRAVEKKVNRFVPEILSCGITTIAAMEGSNYITSFEKDRESELVLKMKEDIPLSIELFYQTVDTDLVKGAGLRHIGGALYLDGTFGSWTAVNSFPYADKKDMKPQLLFQQDYIDNFVKQCCEKQLQAGFDAIGDLAIEMAVSAIEKQKDAFDVKSLRMRIEHGELITPEQMERAAGLGIILSMQPGYEGIWGGRDDMYFERLGENYKKTNPFRELKDLGIVICGGSDYNVNQLNPMEGVYWSVNHPVPEHRIKLEEALAMYTIDGAYALGIENAVGSLTPGKKGDVVILDKSLDRALGEDLKKVRAAMTLRDGEIIYDGIKDA